MVPTIWYGLTSLLLGIVLFFPLRRLMVAMNVNRLQRKLNRELTAAERERIHRKLTILAAAISVTFAFLYNKVLLLKILPGP